MCCRYELPPRSSKEAEPSREESVEEWQARLQAQPAETSLADCLLRVYQVSCSSQGWQVLPMCVLAV